MPDQQGTRFVVQDRCNSWIEDGVHPLRYRCALPMGHEDLHAATLYPSREAVRWDG